jgi:prevent-host-death family protein
MKRIALAAARDQLSRIVNEVAHAGERVILESHGRAKAAIVAIEDLERLDAGAGAEGETMLRWLEKAERHLSVVRSSGQAAVDALGEVREGRVAEPASMYRRQRRTQARRRRGR